MRGTQNLRKFQKRKLESAFDAAVAEVGTVGGALGRRRGEEFGDVGEAFGANRLDETHDRAVLRSSGVFKSGFVGLIDKQKWNVGKAIVFANDENEVAAAEFFTFGFGDDERGRFGFQDFESEMGSADGDDLIADFLESGAIFGSGSGIGIDDENRRTSAADGMCFDGRLAGLLHGSVEMDGNVVTLIGTRNGAHDLSTLRGSCGIGDA